MFWYISCLRPPPLQSPPSKSIPITPQIANDLRTELFPLAAQDLFYSWTRCSSIPSTTRPTKLTTWRESNAYKEVSVPPPPGVGDGQSWLLTLSAHPGSEANVVDLHAPDGLGAPFPFTSMPILFSSRIPKGNYGKQEHIERFYRFYRNDVAVTLTIREQTSFDLDKKIWDSGIGLSSWIVGLHHNSADNSPSILVEMQDTLFSSDPRKILELGSGTGIVALTLASLRSSSLDTITATDLSSAMPLLTHNINSNASYMSSPSVVQAAVLNWEEDIPSEISSAGGLDAIIMADVTYNTSSFPALIRTLSSLIKPSPPTSPPMILLGYKERDPEERSLWDMARDIGVEFKRVGGRRGSGGAEVEIWIGKLETGTNVLSDLVK